MSRSITLTLAILVGCSPSNMGQVSGTVTLDEEPLPAALIEFQPATGAPSYGETDKQGNYVAMYRIDQKGALVGEHTVRITTAGEVTNDEGVTVNVPERVPPRYNAQSELTIEVKPGANRHDFDLVSN